MMNYVAISPLLFSGISQEELEPMLPLSQRLKDEV